MIAGQETGRARPETRSRSRELLRHVGRTAALGVTLVATGLSAGAAKAQNINTLIHKKAVGQAEEIISYAKIHPNKPPILRDNNVFLDSVYVRVSSKTAPDSTTGTHGDYRLVADIPAPPQGRYQSARKINPHELKFINPHEVQGLVISDGEDAEITISENLAHKTWSFDWSGGVGADHHFHEVTASTSPTAKHPMTVGMVNQFFASTQQVITAAEAKPPVPIDFIDPPF